MSLIGSHDAYTSWSATVVLPTQTYDNSQDVQYVAPQAPVVVTNPTTNVGTVLDSDFIEQIVRRNQENIYDSSKAQKIAILTDENGIAYGKQLDIDLLTVKNTTQDTLLATHTTNIDEITVKNTTQDTLLATNTTNIATNTTNIATNTASIAANNAFIVQTDDSLTQDIDNNTTQIANNTASISTTHSILNTLTTTLTASIDNNDNMITNVQDDIDNVIFPQLDANTAQTDTNLISIDAHTASLASQASSINSINVTQTTMNANIYNQISNQVTNRTLSSDGTVIRESIDDRFNLYGLDTELIVRGEFYGNFTSGANNVKGHIRKAAFHNVDGTSVIHNDVTFVMREGDYWKMTRYYWNPMSQTIPIEQPNREGSNTLPEMRYVPDALNNVMPIGDITNTDDLTAEVIHSNFWTHANVNNTGNGHIIQNSVFTYHMRNLVYTPTAERIALKSVQDTILTTVAKITNPPAPYYDYNWFAMESVGVNSVELRLPENSLIFAGSLYRTRENDNPITKLIPYLDNQGRLNSGHLWEAEFANQAYAAPNSEKYPNYYVAGLVPAMPIADVQTNLRYEYFLNGEGHWTRDYTNQLHAITTTVTQLLSRMEDQITGLVAVNSAGRTTTGGLVTFGDNAAITGSPVAIGYVNALGRLNTARLFDNIFNDQVFGVEDPDTVSGRRKSNAYLSGLVPTAENVTDRTTKYLRADGTWSLVPVVDDTKVGNMNIQKGGTDYTFLYHGSSSNYDGIRFGKNGMFQLNSGGGGTPNATMEFRVDNQLYAVFSRPSNNIQFLKSTTFTNDIRWNPTGSAEVSLTTLYSDVETIKNDVNTLPDFDTITAANKFCITNTANGGTISYVTPTTSDVNEGTNLYYTDDRVASKITTALQGGEIANIITNQLQAQTLIANSDIRLKKNIVRLKEDNIISTLEPVKYVFKNDSSKRTRYGFIAQDVEEKLPELVHTNCDSIKGINYQDIIALLVKDNQELRSVCEELESRLSLLEMKN